MLAIVAFGIKGYLWHFVRFFEFLLVIAIFVIAIIELVQDNQVPNIKDDEFFLRLAKFYLIARKISVSWMKLEELIVLKSYEKEVIILEDLMQS